MKNTQSFFFKKFKLGLVFSIKYSNIYLISLPPSSKLTLFPIYTEDKILSKYSWVSYERYHINFFVNFFCHFFGYFLVYSCKKGHFRSQNANQKQ